jgi:hypothetical protein
MIGLCIGFVRHEGIQWLKSKQFLKSKSMGRERETDKEKRER